ncbi:MAG: hypothetical protein U9R60_05135 [Bacteroidota bacterium]|nr:hypothetical protein [Bacteroidota bacterium]
MFKRDSIIFGLLLGIVIPILAYAILYLGLALVELLLSRDLLNERPALKLISIAFNLLVLRYYFVTLKFEKTGKGILIITFAYAIVYFIIY